MNKVPKKANKAIGLLDDLVTKLHYFYGEHPDFRRDVVNPASQIENILKELAINKKETHKRIADKYEKYYKKKQDASDAVAAANDASLNESVKSRYRLNTKKDRE